MELKKWQRIKNQVLLGFLLLIILILPICANCKKIRDDRGYWNQIESYIKNHSEAQFSHSMCPECAEKLYPKLRKGKTNTP